MKLIVGLWSRNTQHSSHFLFADTDARMLALTNAVQAVQQRIVAAADIPDNQPVQGIFVAPEYLFTAARWDARAARSMSEDAKNAIRGRLVTLSEQYPRILLVPGTIAWKKAFARDHTHKRDPLTGQRTGALKIRSRYQKALDSIASGPGSFYPETHANVGGAQATIPGTAQKSFAIGDAEAGRANAPTHMQRNTAYVLLNGEIRFKYHKKGDFHEAIGDAGTVFVPGEQTGSVLIEGIRFGLEICRDHAMGVLGRDLTRAIPGPQVVDVHIISSAWVQQIDANIKVRPLGYLLHACSYDVQTSVTYRGPLLTLPLSATARDVLNGDPLQYWKIDLYLGN